MSNTEKDTEVPTSPTAEARQPEVAGSVATVAQTIAGAVDGAVIKPEKVESPDQKLNMQGLALLKAGRVNEFNALRGKNCNWKPNFSMTNLSDAHLLKVNLSRTNLRKANFFGAFLLKADLHEADLSGADLRKADLREADLSGADLRKAFLREADLRSASLFEANLAGAYVEEANLFMVRLVGADLSGVEGLTAIQLSTVSLLRVTIDPSQKPLLEKTLRLIGESIKIKVDKIE